MIRKYFISIILHLILLALFMPLIGMAEQVRIRVNTLNVRNCPGLSCNVISEVYINDKFIVLEEQEGWIKIQLDTNRNGWVNESYVDYLPTTTEPPPPPSDNQKLYILLLFLFIISIPIYFLIKKYKKNKRAGWITFFAFWQMILALFFSFTGLLGALAIEYNIGIFFFIFYGSISMFGAIGLLRLKNWARITIIIKSFFDLLWFFAYISPYITTVPIATIVYLVFFWKKPIIIVHPPTEWWDFKFFYETNAFRLSGCSIDSSTSEMRAVLGELQNRLITDKPIDDIVIPLEFNEVNPTLQDVGNADGNIRLTDTRIKEEFLWFWIKDNDKKDIEILRSSAWEELRKKWEKNGKDGESLHNLAIYWHIKAISIDREEIKINGKQELSGSSFNEWQKAIEYWGNAYVEEIKDPAFKVSKENKRRRISS